MADSSEELIAKAVSFLSSATGRSTQEKEQFLLEKGLTQDQIQEAYRRVDDSKGRPGTSQGMTPTMPGQPQPPAPTPPSTPVPPPRPMPPRPVTPSYPSTGPSYPAPSYPGYQAPYAPPAPPGPPMPPMMYQGYPLPLEPPSTGGPWWAWLLGGLGAGLVGTYLANPFRLRPEDGLDPRDFFTDAMEKPKDSNGEVVAKQSDTGGEPDSKASYEELLSLLRQQSEEAKANVSMCAKTLQQTQEQHQKMFAEMQKALQNTQQKSSKPQTMELSASTIQALATMIQNAWSGGEPENGTAPSLPSVTSGPALAKGSPSGAAPSPAPLPSPGAQGSTAPATSSQLSLRESFDAINASLQRLVTESNTKQEATKSLNTVAMILSNFLKDPNSDRNKKVNTSGARFSEIFRNNSAAGELLKLAGFQYQHPNFVFNEAGQNAEGAQRTLDLVQEAQRNIDQTWSTRENRQTPVTPAPVPSTGATVAPAAAAATPLTPGPVNPVGANSTPEAARPWASRQPPPGAPQAWVNMTRDINEDPPQAPVGPAPAHPAETLPPAIAHPAESEARPVERPVPVAAPAQPSFTPQQMHLPIAHPAQAASVGEAPAHPAEATVEEEAQESQPQSGG